MRYSHFPSIKTLRTELVHCHRAMRQFPRKQFLDKDCNYAAMDVRLQVNSSGWNIRTGDSSYDTDHNGYWGSSCITWERENLEDVAKDLIEQAKSMMEDR